MSYTSILIHIVWSTKNRKKILDKYKKDIICEHIKEYAIKNNIHILNINGCMNHLHCLIYLMPSQNIANVVQLLKGESSHWINNNFKFFGKFDWQDEYFAVSVSESMKNVMFNYINKQEEHHLKKTFEQEYKEFIDKYKFDNHLNDKFEKI
jgi:REP element-mobilizing transposase RayT